ncbi:MAG: HAMP domain-containing protein [Anaerolineales bacterium]|nr:HAMP domain-containing protein [Anaerolineales bacterium]
MNNSSRIHLPIRARLTLWYVALLGITFSLLGVYLIYQFQRSLAATVDRSLQITVDKTVAALDEEDFHESGKLTFDIVEKSKVQSAGFAMRIVSPQGEVWDTFGEIQNVPNWGPAAQGFTTQTGIVSEDDEWRVFSRPVVDSANQTIAFVQGAQSVASISETLQDLQEQILLGIPLILIFAGAGGYFLADRSLRLIQQITQAAQEITAQDLSRRLEYKGAKDEIGNLADTFDQMIGRLQASFERERRFIGDAAHELRTPLTILKGQLEVTLGRTRTANEYAAKLRELAEQVDRLIALSNNLLFLSRAGEDRLIPKEERVELKEAIEILVEQMTPMAEEKEIRVDLNLQEVLVVQGDRDLLIRLFLNILENAIKYTPPSGNVYIAGMQKRGAVEITIRNSGIHIATEHLPHLFDRFYRVDVDRSNQTGGVGLGLAIAREIVNQHHGRIEAQSSQMQGVTILVEFPAVE